MVIHTIISTCTKKDFPVFCLTYEGVCRQFSFDKWYIIVPDRDEKLFARFRKANIFVVKESLILDFKPIKSKLAEKGNPRWQWYYQQLLKIYKSLDTDSKYVTIWDADTVPLLPIEFFDINNSKVYHNLSEEFHYPYFIKINSLLGIKERVAPGSFITQYITFRKEHLQNMVHHVESYTGKKFIDAVLDPIFDFDLYFSEYETIGNYLHHFYPETYEYKIIEWRRFLPKSFPVDLSYNLLLSTSRGICYQAIESYDYIRQLSPLGKFLYRIRYISWVSKFISRIIYYVRLK